MAEFFQIPACVTNFCSVSGNAREELLLLEPLLLPFNTSHSLYSQNQSGSYLLSYRYSSAFVKSSYTPGISS